MLQGYVLLPSFTVVVDIVTEFVGVLLPDLLNVDDCVLMSETVEGFMDDFIIRKEAFRSTGFKVNLGLGNVLVSLDISKDRLSICKFFLCHV